METGQAPEAEESNLTGNEDQPEHKSRFNLRKLNLPPVRRDHSRSVDYSKMVRGYIEKEDKESKEKSSHVYAPKQPAKVKINIPKDL